MSVLLGKETVWVCPNCDLVEVTTEVAPHTRFHACRGLALMTAPMVQQGVRCKVEAVEREDYLNGEIVTRDGEGRPIMSVVTTRDEGQDCVAFAPTARWRDDGN